MEIWSSKVRFLMAFPLFLLLFLSAGCGVSSGNQTDDASSYPAQDIEFIVPFEPGGGYDNWARVIAPFIEKHLPNDVAVVVRNVPGAGGQTAASQMYAAKPDGSQIQIFNLNGLVVAELGGEANFKLRDFTYLGQLARDPQILTVAGDSDINTIEDLSEMDVVRFGISGFTTNAGMILVVLNEVLGVNYTPINHDGNSDARLSVIRGDTEANIGSVESALGELESGDLKPILYIGEPLRESNLGFEEVRGVQTLADAGYPELVGSLETKRVIAAPPDLPEDIKQVLEQAIQDALADPDFQAQVEEGELTPAPLNADETTEMVNETLYVLSKYEDDIRQAIESG